MTMAITPHGSVDQRDAAQLEMLSRNYRPSLTRYFRRRLHAADDVDDLVQEVFLRLIKRGQVSELEQIGAYLFQTASSVLNDYLRRRRSHQADKHDSFDPDLHADADFAVDRVMEGQERLRHATALLLELPERTRNVFILRRIEGMRYADIARRLGISVSAVEKHVQRAVVHLMGRMGAQ